MGWAIGLVIAKGHLCVPIVSLNEKRETLRNHLIGSIFRLLYIIVNSTFLRKWRHQKKKNDVSPAKLDRSAQQPRRFDRHSQPMVYLVDSI